jgi:hypothetical protein
MSLAMLRQSRSTMPKIAAFEDNRASLRDAVCFWRFQTRAKAQVYARLSLSRLDLSALADFEVSPAIYRRVWLENERLVA